MLAEEVQVANGERHSSDLQVIDGMVATLMAPRGTCAQLTIEMGNQIPMLMVKDDPNVLFGWEAVPK